MVSFAVVLALLCAAHVITARDTLDCVETAKRFGSINFISALEDSGLTDSIRNLNTGTIFVPTNAAFLNLPDRFRQQYQNDMKYFIQAILNHVLNGNRVMYNDLLNENVYNTLASNASVRINTYSKSGADFKTVNGAPITADANLRDVQCNEKVLLHFVDQLITSVSTFDVITLVQRNSSFSNFSRIYSASSNATQQILNQTAETVFIPDDFAFGKLPNGTVDMIVKDQSLANEVLLTHIIDNRVYFSQSFVDKMNLTNHLGAPMYIGWDKNLNKFTINSTGFVDYDIAGKNGVYHIVDTVLWKKPATLRTIDDIPVEVL